MQTHLARVPELSQTQIFLTLPLVLCESGSLLLGACQLAPGIHAECTLLTACCPASLALQNAIQQKHSLI